MSEIALYSMLVPASGATILRNFWKGSAAKYWHRRILVWGSGFRVGSLEMRVWGLGFTIRG